MKKQGLFITFEGIDGCGKSTQVRRAARFLEDKKIPILVTREPGGTPIAEKIRDIILSPDHDSMTNRCELLLYLASRAQHVQEKMRPALEKGVTVLCDRFQEATFAYQGFGRGFLLSTVNQLNQFSTNGLKPSRTYIFDISIECAFSRMKKMVKVPDRIEKSSKELYQKILEGYLKLASNEPSRIKIIDGEESIGSIYNKICDDLSVLFA